MRDDKVCPIWETPATVCQTSGKDGREFDSARAGGKYYVPASKISERISTIARGHGDPPLRLLSGKWSNVLDSW